MTSTAPISAMSTMPVREGIARAFGGLRATTSTPRLIGAGAAVLIVAVVFAHALIATISDWWPRAAAPPGEPAEVRQANIGIVAVFAEQCTRTFFTATRDEHRALAGCLSIPAGVDAVFPALPATVTDVAALTPRAVQAPAGLGDQLTV